MGVYLGDGPIGFSGGVKTEDRIRAVFPLLPFLSFPELLCFLCPAAFSLGAVVPERMWCMN